MRITVAILLLLLSFSSSFAEDKEFIKEGTEAVPAHQSQEQVITYLTQRLTREATEEAGVFIKSFSELKNGKLTKDEITSVAGSVSEVKVLERESLLENGQPKVFVKVLVKVNTDTVKSYVKKISEDNDLKAQLDNILKEKRKLEEQLKTATKQQYETTLSIEVSRAIEEQKKRAIEIEKMAVEARAALAQAESEQRQREIERKKRLDDIRKQTETEELETKRRIANEKDAIKKAELENQARIRELENKAKENVAAWQGVDALFIEDVLTEAITIRREIAKITKSFESRIKANKESLTKSYDKEISNLKNGKFSEPTPVKDAWESTPEYNVRVAEYNNRKAEFIATAKTRADELVTEKEISLLIDETESLSVLIKTITPFIDRLKEFQTKSFYSRNNIPAKLHSLGEPNADSLTFPINISYDKKTYQVIYSFANIGRDKAKAIYQTQDQFMFRPLFSLTQSGTDKLDNVTYLPIFFNVRHLGASVNTDIKTKGIAIADFAEYGYREKYIKTMAAKSTPVTEYYIKMNFLDEARSYIENMPMDVKIISLELLAKYNKASITEYNELALYYESKKDISKAKHYYFKSDVKLHLCNVNSVAFSPDGKLLAKGSCDNTLEIWDVLTEKEIKTLKGYKNTSIVTSIVFSYDGSFLATGSDDNTARIWNIETGKEIKTFIHTSDVNSVSFSPNGQLLAMGSWCVAKIWNTKTGMETKTLEHSGDVKSVAFSNDGKLLATGSDDKTAKVWEIPTGKEIKTFEHQSGVNSVSFSPDGKFLATGSGNGLAIIWNATTVTEIKALKHGGDVLSVAFSPDGQFLATGSKYGTAKIWDVKTGKEMKTLAYSETINSTTVSFSPDGLFLATASGSGIASTWFVGDIYK